MATDVGVGTWDAVTDVGVGAWDAVTDVGVRTGDMMTDVGVGAWDAVTDVGVRTGDMMTDVGVGAWDAVTDVGVRTGDMVTDVGVGTWDAVTDVGVRTGDMVTVGVDSGADIVGLGPDAVSCIGLGRGALSQAKDADMVSTAAANSSRKAILPKSRATIAYTCTYTYTYRDPVRTTPLFLRQSFKPIPAIVTNGANYSTL